ncbi:hypothetical protein EK21DRAFT_95688 [Setomelanomma holmii]|uniref:Uncharacterized protein n=1 Tax=Setomelanomma holmii TaxID=210430 RepID=A0A9P4GT56_9PLEO|nr:hypothetical protein EK21DRAFT_95688 [Setomelanomma holmii]
MQWVVPAANDSTSSLQKRDDCRAEDHTTWLIVAKERPLWARKRLDISRLPLHRSTWCLVINPNTNASRFELLITCQEKSMLGIETYRDIDCGLGIHPEADQKWMRSLIDQQTQLTSADYRVQTVACRPIGQQDYITVLLDILNLKMKSLLMTMRKESGQGTDSLVRLSFSAFKSIRGDKESVLKTLKCTEEGRKVLERRARRAIDARRRKRCRRRVRCTGQSMCEEYALNYGISFGSEIIYSIQKARKLTSKSHLGPLLCCGRARH